MATSIRCKRVSHLNVVVQDYETSVAHLRDLFGAEYILDLPKPEWHAWLSEIGGVIFEFFAPPNFLLHARHGPHYQGIEYQADMDEVRAAVADHGVRIIRELVVAVHTHPADAYGADFEFYSGSFHDNDPPVLTQLIKPAAYWRDEHPLGLLGLKAHTHMVSDIEAASRFMQSFVSGELLYDEARPALGARAIGLQVADAVLELLAPTGAGPLRSELEIIGQGIRSTVFQVRDLEQARRYFESRGTPLIAGSSPERFAIDPAANLGLLFEFSA
jgi:catechol 2,3-dioxygenase-like lactoylglutathione lyase family enzyme